MNPVQQRQIEGLRDLVEEYADLHRKCTAMIDAGDVHGANYRELAAQRDSRARIIALAVADALGVETRSYKS